MSISRERRAAIVTTKRRSALSRRTSGVVTLSRCSFALGSFHWQLRLFPCFPTAGNIPKLAEPLRFQNARGYACAIAATTINRRWFVPIQLVHPVAQFRDKDVPRTGNMTLFPFAGRAHIEYLQ